MPVYKVNGIVLRRTDLGETDRILRLFTREAGRVDAVAKGARRGMSRLSGATELFTHSRMLLATGKTLDIVSQCEIRESFPGVRADLQRIARGAYLCELVDRFLADREPNAEVFDLLLSGLYLLQRDIPSVDVIVHAFELRLLAEQGYHPELVRCVKCREPLGGRRLSFSPSLGGILCAADRYEADDAIGVAVETAALLRCLSSAEPEDLVHLDPPPKTLKEVARCLKWYIRYRAERDLHSAGFVEMLRH